ncbi:MAG: hypothetical protein ACXVHB_32030 [Solirubrobacteraceae bacterium]
MAWVFAIPASPLNSFYWCTGSLGAVVVMVTTSVIALMHLWVDPPEDSSVADRSQVRTIELTCGCGITVAYEHCDVIDEAQRPDLVAKLATGMIGHGCGACDRTAQSGFPTREHVVQAYEELTWVRHVRDRVVLGLRVLRARVICQRIAARAAGGPMLGSGFGEAQRLVEPPVRAGRRVLLTRNARG